MSTDDVTTILTRLAVIESKVDDMKADKAPETTRIRRLEIAVVIISCAIARDSAHQLISLLGG